jgi:hypothetical protein
VIHVLSRARLGFDCDRRTYRCPGLYHPLFPLPSILNKLSHVTAPPSNTTHYPPLSYRHWLPPTLAVPVGFLLSTQAVPGRCSQLAMPCSLALPFVQAVPDKRYTPTRAVPGGFPIYSQTTYASFNIPSPPPLFRPDVCSTSLSSCPAFFVEFMVYLTAT